MDGTWAWLPFGAGTPCSERLVADLAAPPIGDRGAAERVATIEMELAWRT